MNRRRRLLVRCLGCVAIALVLASGATFGLTAGMLDGFQVRAADATQPRGEASDVVVVGVDARSIDELGTPWPWPRQRHADVLSAIAAARPKAIVYDVVFAPSAPGDDELAEATASAGVPVILAESVSTSGVDERGVLQVEYATRPPDQLVDAAFGIGHTAVVADARDGVVRDVPLVVERDQRYDPSLALAALGVEAGSDQVVVRPDGVQIADRSIPTDADHHLSISWAPELTSEDERVVPVADVLDGRVDPTRLEGKTVFVGVVDPTLGDQHLTPVNHQAGLPGVLVQANAFNTMATHAYVSQASTAESVAVVFALALAVALAVQFLPVWLGGTVAVLSCLAYVVWGLTVRADAGSVVNFVYPIIGAALAVLLSGALRFAVESRQRRLVAGLFSQYVPKSVATKLLDDGNASEFAAGIRVDASVLFCDLRGFTALSARTSPVDVRGMLDRYYEYASRIVLDHGGTLMQYVGDEVYALFGAPVTQPDHAAAAVATARELQQRRAELDAELAEHGWEALRFGIGVNTGSVVAADTGSTWRRQYTAIGEAVNVGSRLCSQADPDQVVIADATRAAVEPAPDATPMGPLDLKGVAPGFVAWSLTLDRQASVEAVP